MLYAHSSDCNLLCQGHIGDDGLATKLHVLCEGIVTIQADGDELVRCCDILGKSLPKSLRVYTFFGVNAQEIAVNWY
jgi:hypothetical protein